MSLSICFDYKYLDICTSRARVYVFNREAHYCQLRWAWYQINFSKRRL